MVSPYPRPDASIRGGVESVMYNLSCGFAETPNVELIILAFGQDKDEVFRAAQNVTVHFIARHFSSTKMEIKMHASKELLRVNDSWNPDIIHVQGNGSALLYYNSSIAKKLVFTQHGVLQGEIKTAKSLRKKLNYLLALGIERRYRNQISNWIFISEYNQKLNSDIIGKGINYRQIYNPVNPDYFTENGICDNRNGYFAARIVPGKGLHVLIKAFGKMQCKGMHFDVIGGFADSDYERMIGRLLSKYGCQENVKFHGWRNATEIRSIVSEDMIMILPSFQETLPVVIAEAMAMGKIVVATNICGIPEMVTPETGFLFAPGDSDALASILDHIQKMPQSRLVGMSLSAHKRAKMLYDPINVAKEHVNFYNKIIGQTVTG